MKALVSIAIMILGSAQAALTAALDGSSNANANQLRTGRFSYRTTMQKKDAGTSEISIREGQSRGTFVYTNYVTGEFSQQWEAIASGNFAPISAKLSFGDGGGLHPAFELQYKDGRVTGFMVSRHSDSGEKRKVDAKIMPDTVDQRIDWAAAISQRELIPGREFAFHVFDPGSGNSRVTARVVGVEQVRVPAGSFQAVRIVYEIQKSSGTEVYQVLTNISGLRMLLKEEFPDGDVIELVKVLDE